jgi:hypothetical protein
LTERIHATADVYDLNDDLKSLRSEPNTERNRIAGTGQFTDVAFCNPAFEAALPPIENQSRFNWRFRIDEIQSDFALALAWPTVGTKTNVLNG